MISNIYTQSSLPERPIPDETQSVPTPMLAPESSHPEQTQPVSIPSQSPETPIPEQAQSVPIPVPVPETPIPQSIEENMDQLFKLRAVLLPSSTDPPIPTATEDSFKLRASLSSSSNTSAVPTTLESLFTPHAKTHKDDVDVVGKRLHAKLSNVSASSRLRKISDVEECEVQPELSNYPLRYGQRRQSNTSRQVCHKLQPLASSTGHSQFYKLLCFARSTL